jgi:hypothetical protein
MRANLREVGLRLGEEKEAESHHPPEGQQRRKPAALGIDCGVRVHAFCFRSPPTTNLRNQLTPTDGPVT